MTRTEQARSTASTRRNEVKESQRSDSDDRFAGIKANRCQDANEKGRVARQKAGAKKLRTSSPFDAIRKREWLQRNESQQQQKQIANDKHGKAEAMTAKTMTLRKIYKRASGQMRCKQRTALLVAGSRSQLRCLRPSGSNRFRGKNADANF
jgi:hypothetical protein